MTLPQFSLSGTLDKAVNKAVARETAKRCQDGLEADRAAALSAYKKELRKPKFSDDQCRSCGKKHHESKSDCPAKDNLQLWAHRTL